MRMAHGHPQTFPETRTSVSGTIGLGSHSSRSSVRSIFSRSRIGGVRFNPLDDDPQPRRIRPELARWQKHQSIVGIWAEGEAAIIRLPVAGVEEGAVHEG